jgi:hypothetical protein
MRKIQFLLLTVTLACLTFPAGFTPCSAIQPSYWSVALNAAEPPIPTPSHAGTKEDPWPLYNTQTISAGFDNTYQETQIVRADVEVLDESGNKIDETSLAGIVFFPKDQTVFKIPIRAEVELLVNGLYSIRSRVWDEHGNVSDWSEPIWGRKLWQPLESPGGCVIFR